MIATTLSLNHGTRFIREIFTQAQYHLYEIFNAATDVSVGRCGQSFIPLGLHLRNRRFSTPDASQKQLDDNKDPMNGGASEPLHAVN
jgi:hypothetical protein